MTVYLNKNICDVNILKCLKFLDLGGMILLQVMLILFILFVIIRIIMKLLDFQVYQIQFDIHYALFRDKVVKNEN